MSGLVVIGTSQGGLRAVETVLGSLPGDFALPMVVVQHRADDNSRLLDELLRLHSALDVCEAEDKAPLRQGCVLVAPAGYHLLVEPGHVELSTETEPGFSRPSIDVAMETAAEAYGAAAVGVVLTGRNDDGAIGLAALRRRGGIAIVQDPASAEQGSMPAAAVAAADPHWVLPVEEIGQKLVSIAGVVAEAST